MKTTTWTTGESRVSISGSSVRWTNGERALTCEASELYASAIWQELLDAFGVETAAEALAVSKHPDEVARACVEPAPRRPRHPRVFGGKRGDSWVAWIFGRKVRLSANALPHMDDVVFEEVLERGLPEAFMQECGPEVTASLMQAITDLAPLACMCGTGAETSQQHGQTRTLARAREPRSMVEYSATCARCEVCSRWWTFVERGDSHYSYSYSVSLFRPGQG